MLVFGGYVDRGAGGFSVMDETAHTVFADECGYTGRALLDDSQPVFVLVSLNLSEENAVKLRSEFFGSSKARELKHVSLARRTRWQKQILRLLNWLSRNQDLVSFGCIHKEFALLAKSVDWVIEPSFRKHGVDFYKDGANIAFTNMTYIVLRSLGGDEFFAAFLQAFQDLMLKPDIERLQRFEAVINSRRSPKEVDDVLDYYRVALLDLGFSFLDDIDPTCLDTVLSVTLCVMAEWANRGVTPFRLIQDESSEMAREKELWNIIVAPGVKRKKVGLDRRTMQYPIGIQETLLAPSHEWIGLQLADLVSGSIARGLRSSLGKSDADQYGTQVREIIEQWICTNSIWPSAAVSPDELGTTGPKFADPIEHIEEFNRRLQRGS